MSSRSVSGLLVWGLLAWVAASLGFEACVAYSHEVERRAVGRDVPRDVQLRWFIALDRQLQRARRADAHARGLEAHRSAVVRVRRVLRRCVNCETCVLGGATKGHMLGRL